MASLRGASWRAGAVAGATILALWGFAEPLIPLSRLSGVTHLPFPLASFMLVACLAVSVACYSLAGLLLGSACGGLLGAFPRLRAHAGAITAVLLGGAALAFGALYFVNRMVPGSYRSPRSLRASALGLAIALAIVGLGWLASRLARRALRGRPAAVRALLRLRTAALALAGAAMLLALGLRLQESLPRAATRALPDAPNVILVSVDALRADHLHCYGYPRETSPAMDALAEGGVLFEQTHSQAPSSTPGHASMLTGLYPMVHGAVRNGDVLPEEVLTLAEAFQAAGYETGAFVTNAWINRLFGFSQGFDLFVEGGILQLAGRPSFAAFAANLWAVQTWEKLRDRDLSYERALRWVSARRHHRFFLFLHLLDPHGPYDPPAGHLARFLPPGADNVAETVAAYDGEILVADEKIGALVEKLRRLGLAERTVVCVTADHGENMDEHGASWAHGTLYQSNLLVPFIVAQPGRIPAGERVREPVESVDIAPTLLALAGIAPPEAMQGRPGLAAGPEGAALLAADPERPVFAQRGEDFMVRRGDWKLLLPAGGAHPALYDLAADPRETADLAAADHPAARELTAVLLGWIEAQRPRARTPESRIEQLDAATVARLKALGYLQ